MKIERERIELVFSMQIRVSETICSLLGFAFLPKRNAFWKINLVFVIHRVMIN